MTRKTPSRSSKMSCVQLAPRCRRCSCQRPSSSCRLGRGGLPAFDRLRRGTLREKVPAEVDGAAPADIGSAARQPFLSLAAAGTMQIREQLEVGLALALGRERAGETASLDEVEAMAGNAHIAGARAARPSPRVRTHGLDHLDV